MTHPLDPLTGDEIGRAAGVVRAHGGLGPRAWFETIALQEPSKQELSDRSARRQAFVCCYDPESGTTWDGVVDLTEAELSGWRHVVGAQARIVAEEFAAGGEAAKRDPDFIAACAKRGITDMSQVLVEPWAAGHFDIPGEEGIRIGYGHCFVRNEAGDNPYARPIAKLHPVIDLRNMTVLRIDDFGAEPLPPESAAIVHPAPRTDVKPLEISQPLGPSFAVDGHQVRWQKWHLRVGFNVREGLVLHEIGYEHGGRVRPIMHRASLAEMVVPYGDPTGAYFRRNAFDTGEYGVGQLADSLALGCDCLGHIHYFDAWVHNWLGEPRRIPNAICMHEEDFGILWKFTDPVTGAVNVRRSRRLVISSISSIGNYVYGFFWYFYQDGTIGVEVKATGIVMPAAIPVGSPSDYGALVAPGIDGHVHQHVFSFRFDMTVDGERNSVSEMNFEALPVGPDNRYGNAIAIQETMLRRESSAQRSVNLDSSRYWKVFNRSVTNAVGAPVAYKLVPGTNAKVLLDPDSPVGRRAGFMFQHFWATQFAADERFSAGTYPNQHPGGDGLPRYVAHDRNLDDENVVVWYTLNYHHLPRPEDWPVQPCVYADFHWMPVGFFDCNPALDVP